RSCSSLGEGCVQRPGPSPPYRAERCRPLRRRASTHRARALLPAHRARSGSPPAGRAHRASRRADRAARACCDTPTQCRPIRADGCAPSRCDRFRRSDRRAWRRHPRGATHDQRGAVVRSPSEVPSRAGSSRRLLSLAAPGRRRFFTACGLGVLAVGSGVGLIACAAWLISAASLQPHIAALTVAIVGVRMFALAKAVLRYLERLVSHDVAFRMLATIRMRFVTALEPLSPGALPVYHRGDLLARMVSDVDGLQELPLRVLQPVAVAAGAAALAVGIVATLLPSSAAVLAATLAVAAVAAPAATSWANRHAEARLATVRAELSTSVVTLLNARADLVAYGAAPQHLAELRDLDARLTRIARSSALAPGAGPGRAAGGVGRARPRHIRGTCRRPKRRHARRGGLDSACGLRGRADPSDCDARVQQIAAKWQASHRSDGHTRAGNRAVQRWTVGPCEPVADFVAGCGSTLVQHAFVGARRSHRRRP